MDLLQSLNFASYVWIAGLAVSLIALVGLLFQKRRIELDPYGYADELAWMVALYLGLGLFCLGLALNTFASTSSLSIWIGNIWLSLAFLLFIRFGQGIVEGVRNGWHEDQTDAPPFSGIGLWMGIAALLLTVNLGLVLWAGLAANNENVDAGSSTSPIQSTLQAGPSTPEIQPTEEALTEAAAPEESQGEETSRAEILPSPTSESEAAAERILPLPTATKETEEAVPVISATETLTPALTADSDAIVLLLPTPTPSNSDGAADSNDGPTANPAGLLPGIVIGEVGINVRSQPDLAADIVGALSEGASVNATGRTQDGEWIQLALEDGGRGWVAAFLVQLEGEAAGLPIEDDGATQ